MNLTEEELYLLADKCLDGVKTLSHDTAVVYMVEFAMKIYEMEIVNTEN